MARRLLPALLVFTALLLDVGGGHGAALALLLVGIPAAFMLVLDCYGDVLDGRCGRLRPALAALALFLVVLSAALRSPAVVGGLPRFALSALVVTLFLYAGVALGALVAPRRTAVVAFRAHEAPARRRRAA
ncbi:hypothetical protein BH18ACT12_BH18ACT12_23930 [soil metagenome]